MSETATRRYAELQCASHFSFLRGASGCDELFAQAAVCGLEALAITDRNSVAGIVRAHEAAKATGVRLVIGCRLELVDETAILVYPTDRAAYSRLCRLLTLGKGRAGKGACRLDWSDLADHAGGLIAVLVTDRADASYRRRLSALADIFGADAYCALTLRRRPRDQMRLHQLSELAQDLGVNTVVTNDVLFHHPDRRILQDVLTCIREGCTIDDVGFKRERSADRHLKRAEEMHRLFARYPDALRRSVEIADRCRFNLDELSYQYPREAALPGLTPQQALERLTWEGAAGRYPDGLPDKVRASLKHELTLIEALGYAPYFLTVNSIVRFARSRDILCQGRGSAANSAVCFVLGITSIDPGRNHLLFERFVSQERKEPPDIDVDFEHERREEVIQWVYETYGRDRAALCATVIRYRSRGALRAVGKALGLSEDLIKTLSSQVWSYSSEGVEDRHAEELNLNLQDRRLRLALDLSRQLIGFPRHLSQHPGGFVLTDDRLDDLVPIEPAAMKDRQVIEWDKDDIDALKFMKVDVLALGMLTRHSDEDGRTAANTPSGDREDPDEDWLKQRINESERFRRQIVVQGSFDPARLTLSQRHNIHERHLGAIVSRSPFVRWEQQGLMALGFTRLLQGDDQSAVHLLVPQLEPCLRHVLRVADHDPVVDFDDMTEENVSLSAMLGRLRPQLEAILPPATVLELELLFDFRAGSALRHAVAHGRIGTGGCHTTEAVYACWLLYQLTCWPLLRTWDSITAPAIREQC